MKHKLIFLLSPLFSLLPQAHSMNGEESSPSSSDINLKSVLNGTTSDSAQVLEKGLSDRLNALSADSDGEGPDDSNTKEELGEQDKKLFEKKIHSKEEAELRKNLCELIATYRVRFSTRDLNNLIKKLGCTKDDLLPKKTESKTKTEVYKRPSCKSIFGGFGSNGYGRLSKRSQKPSMVRGNIVFSLDDFAAYDSDGPFARYMKEQSAGKKSRGKTNRLSTSRQPREQASNAQKRKGSDPILEKKKLSIPPHLSKRLEELEKDLSPTS